MRIEKISWDEDSVDHIGRHSVINGDGSNFYLVPPGKTLKIKT